ncbi:hypothetical protein [Truepera radiovictrix]|uniref:Uncharacterized protein n=1 Tax=Truepera radiovictrix (strain DSM 17093 / CIP 108686 / LMG 22925 / RQ-24) TaxID=649638 RepID=D7CV47_TRURR|nr:hypothetical protein [Truepera radiovictrix]ADI15874.1 hypothetical protein Trad_2772 [Truepera radiovictrix DSM 17093]WMT58500.1 hypothetical protein RCV51_06030 [Truepera radiovictrix]
MTYARLCGQLGQLYPVGGELGERHTCLVWRTEPRLLGCASGVGALYRLACDVADLYHAGRSVLLRPERRAEGRPQRPPLNAKVLWLECTVEGALLVFLQPLGRADSPREGGATADPATAADETSWRAHGTHGASARGVSKTSSLAYRT